MQDVEKELKKRNTREGIKTTFLEMYKKTPVNKIAVNNIVKACGISRGTFYFYFEDVYALYHECEKDMLYFLEKEVPDVNLATLLRDREKHIEIYCKFLKRYLMEAETLKVFLKGSESASFRQLWFDSIYRNFKASLEYTSVTPSSKNDSLVRFFAGGMLEIFSNWFLTDCNESMEEIARLHEQVLYYGIMFRGKE